jgi:hypothetical protein
MSDPVFVVLFVVELAIIVGLYQHYFGVKDRDRDDENDG